MGSLAMLVNTAASAATNTLKSVDNIACATERLTYVCKSKASNIAELSDTADSMKMLIAKKELDDKVKELGMTFNEHGQMVFA